jgi:type I restriction enzyme S subunit
VISGQFLDLVLRSRYGYESLKRIQTGALHPHLNCTWVRELYVPVPSAPEQGEIVRGVSMATTSFDLAVANLTRDIALFREYRARLIADVVTGKLDVREAAATLPDEARGPEPLDDTAAVDTDEAADDAELDAVPEEDEA